MCCDNIFETVSKCSCGNNPIFCRNQHKNKESVVCKECHYEVTATNISIAIDLWNRIFAESEIRGDGNTKMDKFRSTYDWKKKRAEIQERDNNKCVLCQRDICMPKDRSLCGTDVEVHHISSVREAPDKKMVNSNLISLCRYHHELAEKGDISKSTLREAIKQDSSKD